MQIKTEYSSEIRSTTSLLELIVTMSPTSNGCLTKRNIQEPRISAAVAEKMNERESSAVPVVARVVTRDSFKKATTYN